MTIEEYSKYDLTFNRSKFISDINRMIQKIYYAISNDDLESVHYFISDQVYDKYQNMINNLKKEEKKLKYSNVFIDSDIKEITNYNEIPSIIVKATCNYSKYYVKDNEIVSGSNSSLIQTIYSVVVCKKEETKNYYDCSGCGKSYDVMNNKICPNCGCVFEEKYNYYILDIRG